MVTVDILVSHLFQRFLVPSTLHLFLFASFGPCISFLLIFCLSNLFPFASMHVIAFSSQLYRMLFHNPRSIYIHPDHSGSSSLLILLVLSLIHISEPTRLLS